MSLSHIQTRNSIKKGDYEKARTSSSNAKIFNIIAFAVGIVFWIIVVLTQLTWIVPLAIFLNCVARNAANNRG